MVSFPARAIGLAAAAAIVLTVGWWTLRPGENSAPATVYATTDGGYERVVLTDGSVLELNGGTSAEVRFTQAERRVRLARGEAHFAVARSTERPFFVEAGGVAVRAVGTAFNVRLSAHEIEVLVTEGKVELNTTAVSAVRTETLPLPPGAAAGGGATLLVANERALIASDLAARPTPLRAPMVERVTPEALREALAWQAPRLVFADTPLAEVIAQFNRRNAVQLVLADPELATLSVAGSFRAENVEAFVRLLESSRDVRVERPETTRILLRRAK
jgi:transmembrane sensor